MMKTAQEFVGDAAVERDDAAQDWLQTHLELGAVRATAYSTAGPHSVPIPAATWSGDWGARHFLTGHMTVRIPAAGYASPQFQADPRGGWQVFVDLAALEAALDAVSAQPDGQPPGDVEQPTNPEHQRWVSEAARLRQDQPDMTAVAISDHLVATAPEGHHRSLHTIRRILTKYKHLWEGGCKPS